MKNKKRFVFFRLISVAVVIGFFVCYAPLYSQRFFLALLKLLNLAESQTTIFYNLMAYLYIVSGITYYFGLSLNPILYNVLSNKYRRAFKNLFYCRFKKRRRTVFKEQNRPLKVDATRCLVDNRLK